MATQQQLFDPVGTAELLQSLASQPPNGGGQVLFQSLLQQAEQPQAFLQAASFLMQQLQEVDQVYDNRLQKAYQPGLLQQLATSCEPIMPLESNMQADLKQWHPILMTELYWLPAVLQVASSQEPLALAAMAVYLQLLNNDPYQQAMQGLLASQDHRALPYGVFGQETVVEAMFDFAAVQLALAKLPRPCFPELLGFTLACFKTTLPVCPQGTTTPHASFIQTRQEQLTNQIPAIIAIMEQYLDAFPEHQNLLWQRFQRGFYLYNCHAQRCSRYYQQHLQPKSSEEKLADILRAILPKAVGHHGRISLQGKKLDDWFSETPFKACEFLEALRQSRYVDQQNPEQSLILKLFAFGGPMFGVLDPKELVVLQTWLRMPGQERATTNAVKPIFRKKSAPISTPDRASGHGTAHYPTLDNRQLFHRLVNADNYPDSLYYAKHHAKKILLKARLLNRLPFKRYSHQALANYVDSLYQLETTRYQPLKDQPKLPKQAYLWGIEQFAPSILTDGCWLQHCQELNLLGQRGISGLLFKIYGDETGGGLLEQNHPHIYQQLLASVGIEVPPITSQAFSQDPRFLESAFDIPAYLLSISKFPSTFLPELLGLNLAIELSGLGRVYLRLAQELAYYGLDPLIVNVHISIDNLATGHAALAVQAIQLYMDQVNALVRQPEIDRHWRRVYTGYCSLASASMLFKYMLIFKYLLNKK